MLEMNRRTFLVGTAGVSALLAFGVGCNPAPDVPVPVLGLGGLGDLGATGLSDALDTVITTDHANVGIVRLDVNWSVIEGTQGTFNWTGLDARVKAALTRGLEILAVISFTPGWARSGGTSSTPPSSTATYAEFCYQVANRYRPRSGAPDASMTGVDADHGIRYFEIWNEANNKTFWSTAADPDTDGYADLLLAAYKRIKNISASLYIGTSGTAPLPTSGAQGPRPGDFLNGVLSRIQYRVDHDYVPSANAWSDLPFDFVCHHPYSFDRAASGGYTMPNGNYDTNSFAYDTAYLNKIITQTAGVTNMRIWATEVGVPWHASAIAGQGLLRSGYYHTTLSAQMGASATSCTVASGSELPVGGFWVRIGDSSGEIVQVNRNSGSNTLTVTGAGRGLYGTDQDVHASGSNVNLIIPKVATPSEGYNHMAKVFGYWRKKSGYETWPTTPGSVPTDPDTDPDGFRTFDAAAVCGPIFHFGATDFEDASITDNNKHGFPGWYDSYFGLLTNALVRKRITPGQDPYDAILLEAPGSQPAPSARQRSRW